MLLLASSPPHSGTRCSLQIKYAVAQDIYCYHPLYHLVKVFLSCSLSSRTISSFLILFDQLFLLSHGIHSPFYLFHFSVSPLLSKDSSFFLVPPTLSYNGCFVSHLCFLNRSDSVLLNVTTLYPGS